MAIPQATLEQPGAGAGQLVPAPVNVPITDPPGRRDPLRVAAFGMTDAGRVRACNEDQFLIAELAKTMRLWQTSLPEPEAQTGDGRAHLFVVADGMGGQAAGDRASALAVAAVENFALNTLDTHESEAKNVLAQFQAALRHADARVVGEATEHPELSGMGTTVTLAYHLGTHLCIVHVGDSRAYLYRNNTLHQLTEDHTVTAELVRTGNLRPEQVAGHPLRHVITNVVGGERTGVDVETHLLDVRAGDQLLLCSDGFTEMLPNDAIAAIAVCGTRPRGRVQTIARPGEREGRTGQHHAPHRAVRFSRVTSPDTAHCRRSPFARGCIARLTATSAFTSSMSCGLAGPAGHRAPPCRRTEAFVGPCLPHGSLRRDGKEPHPKEANCGSDDLGEPFGR